MSSPGERKSALLLSSLATSDRRRLLSRLPVSSARTIRGLLRELDRMNMPMRDVATALLADEMRGLAVGATLEVDQLAGLSRRLPSPWFARVLAVWTGVDREFCLATMDKDVALSTREELSRLGRMPPKLVEALRGESIHLARLKPEISGSEA